MVYPRRSFCVLIVCVLSFTLLFFFPRSPSQSPIQDPARYGVLNATSESSRYAIATFLTEGTNVELDGAEENDSYYIATRILAYQLLHATETRCKKSIPFLVIIPSSSKVSLKKKERLKQDGATVVLVKDVPLRWWIHTGRSNPSHRADYHPK